MPIGREAKLRAKLSPADLSRRKNKRPAKSEDEIEYKKAVEHYHALMEQYTLALSVGLHPTKPVKPPDTVKGWLAQNKFLETYTGEKNFPDGANRVERVEQKYASERQKLEEGARYKRIIEGGDILRPNRSEDGISRLVVRKPRVKRLRDMEITLGSEPPKHEAWMYGHQDIPRKFPGLPERRIDPVVMPKLEYVVTVGENDLLHVESDSEGERVNKSGNLAL